MTSPQWAGTSFEPYRVGARHPDAPGLRRGPLCARRDAPGGRWVAGPV